MLTECVDYSIIGSYIELGINTHMSVELLLLEGGCIIHSLLRCNYCVHFTKSIGTFRHGTFVSFISLKI